VNYDILELWGRWALATAKGQQHMSSMSGILQDGMQMIESLGSAYRQLWGTLPTQLSEKQKTPAPKNPWEAMTKMQHQWMQMLSSGSCENDLSKNDLSRKVFELEQQVAAQGHVLELLKAQLKIEDADQSEDFAKQFEELIERQNQQFKQFTASFSDFFRERRTLLEGNDNTNELKNKSL